MGMWNDTCRCIDENWKALKARIQASITGITVNGTTHYQTDGTGICDLGTIGGSDDAIVSIKGTALGHVQLIETTQGDGSTESVPFTQYTGTDFDVAYDDGTATYQVSIAQTVKNTIDGAVDAGVTAQTDAAKAQTTANAAFNGYTVARYEEDATQFVGTDFTNANDAHDTKMLFKAGTGVSIGTDGDGPVLNLADTIVAKINGSYAGMSIGVTDGQFLLHMTDNEGNSDELPLFTAGTNLSVEEGDTGYVLNAEGGSGGSGLAYIHAKISELYSGKTLDVGDIFTVNGTFYPSWYIPTVINITTGSYGACVASYSGFTALTISTGQLQYGVTGKCISKVSSDMFIATGICATPINSINTTATVSFTISVDGADAVTVELPVTIRAKPNQFGSYNMVDSSAGISNIVNVYCAIDGIAVYEGLAIKLPVVTRTWSDATVYAIHQSS